MKGETKRGRRILVLSGGYCLLAVLSASGRMGFTSIGMALIVLAGTRLARGDLAHFHIRFRPAAPLILLGLSAGIGTTLLFQLLVFCIYHVNFLRIVLTGALHFPQGAWITLTSAPLAGLFEELLFRGLLWGALRDLGQKESAILCIQAIIFGLVHIAYALQGKWLLFAYAFVLGLTYGWMARFSRSILPGMIAHTFIDFMMILAYVAG